MKRLPLPPLLAAALLLAPVPLQAQPPADETSAKVAILEKLLRLMEWPPEAAQREGVFRITVLGRSPLGDALESSLAYHTLRGHPVAVRYLPDPRHLEACDLVFVTASSAGQLEALRAAIGSRPVLTVGDTPGLARKGIMVNLIRNSDRIGFELNLQSFRSARISLDPGLPRLALGLYPTRP
nr:YfiR family protein [uncultured Holophaga sp.]